jgi:hypothetical protein
METFTKVKKKYASLEWSSLLGDLPLREAQREA